MPLNKITIKHNYPLPHIDDLLDGLNGVKYFSQIDFKLMYYQISIVDKDVKKWTWKPNMAHMNSWWCHLGLFNSPSTFITLMNSIFYEKLNKFMIIYIDDILLYSKSMEGDTKHLEYVLNKFQQNNFFVNNVKNEFA